MKLGMQKHYAVLNSKQDNSTKNENGNGNEGNENENDLMNLIAVTTVVVLTTLVPEISTILITIIHI